MSDKLAFGFIALIGNELHTGLGTCSGMAPTGLVSAIFTAIGVLMIVLK